MLITVRGVLIRIPVKGVSVTGRNTQGVRLIRLHDDEEVATVAKVDPDPEEDAQETDNDQNVDTVEDNHDDGNEVKNDTDSEAEDGFESESDKEDTDN